MPETHSTQIASLDEALIANHRHDKQLFAELDALQRELGILSDDRPFSPFLRYQFMGRSLYERVAEASEVLAGAFEKMALAALEDQEILGVLGLDENEERFARMDPGYPGVCHSSRLDAFVAGGELKFLEYNGETPAGITDQLQIEKVLSRIPEVREFMERHRHWLPRPHEKLLEALVSAYRDFGGRKDKPNIAIVDWKGVSTYSEFVVLAEYFRSQGHETVVGFPDELDYDGSTLTLDGFEIDIFYKRVIIHELFEREAPDHPIFRAYEDGNLFMANSFRSKVPHKKAGFAVLGDERFSRLFNSKEHEMIRRHLPWTRKVSDARTTYFGEDVGLLDYIRSGRERFVLKPNDDYGGSGIAIGWESTESEWDDAIETALGSQYVVQERVRIERVPFPTYTEDEALMADLLIDLDPFIFRGKVEGALVRLSPQTLVNVAVGGGETALAVLEDA
ncbi:MAG TPA: hypothetical protein PKD11_08750 [Pyrinomonadaceae bacterium]|nr:hypothetical protein [Pyrinomonadaceae bacterium]